MTDPNVAPNPTTGRGRDGGEEAAFLFSTPACPEHGDYCVGDECCCRDLHPAPPHPDTARLDWLAANLTSLNYWDNTDEGDTYRWRVDNGWSPTALPFRAAIDAAIASQHPRDGDEQEHSTEHSGRTNQ